MVVPSTGADARARRGRRPAARGGGRGDRPDGPARRAGERAGAGVPGGGAAGPRAQLADGGRPRPRHRPRLRRAHAQARVTTPPLPCDPRECNRRAG